MPPWVSSTIAWLQKHLSVRMAALLVAMVSAILLFGPADWLKFFALDAIARTYRGWISVGFLVCLCTLALGPIFSVWDSGGKAAHKFWYRRRIRGYMENLKTDEMGILLEYAQTRKSSIRFSQTNGTVRGLIDKRILYVPQQVGQVMNDSVACNLTAEASDLLRYKKFQEMLTKSSRDQF